MNRRTTVCHPVVKAWWQIVVRVWHRCCSHWPMKVKQAKTARVMISLEAISLIPNNEILLALKKRKAKQPLDAETMHVSRGGAWFCISTSDECGDTIIYLPSEIGEKHRTSG